jgi:hypothetical protein
VSCGHTSLTAEPLLSAPQCGCKGESSNEQTSCGAYKHDVYIWIGTRSLARRADAGADKAGQLQASALCKSQVKGTPNTTKRRGGSGTRWFKNALKTLWRRSDFRLAATACRVSSSATGVDACDTEFTAGACRNESCNWLTLRSGLRRYRSTLDGECPRATRPLFLASKFSCGAVLSPQDRFKYRGFSRSAEGCRGSDESSSSSRSGRPTCSLRGAINGLSRVAEAIAAVPAKERSKALTVAEASYRPKRAGSRL